jgi:hypothetical protein
MSTWGDEDLLGPTHAVEAGMTILAVHIVYGILPDITADMLNIQHPDHCDTTTASMLVPSQVGCSV